MNAVFCKTVFLPQFRPPFRPNRHTFVPLLYNHQKKTRCRKHPTLTPFLPHRSGQNGILLGYFRITAMPGESDTMVTPVTPSIPRGCHHETIYLQWFYCLCDTVTPYFSNH